MTWEVTAPRMSRVTLAAFASHSPTFAWCASTSSLNLLVASYLLMLVLQPQALSMVWYMVETGPDSMGTWVVPVRSASPSPQSDASEVLLALVLTGLSSRPSESARPEGWHHRHGTHPGRHAGFGSGGQRLYPRQPDVALDGVS